MTPYAKVLVENGVVNLYYGKTRIDGTYRQEG